MVKGFTVFKFEDKEVAQNVLSTITEDVLSDREFVECGKHDALKQGYTSFTDGSFILNNGASTAVNITTQTKKVKKSELDRRCKKAEKSWMQEHGEEVVPKDVKEDFKFTITQEMLPETPADKEVTSLLWITGDKLIVGVPTFKKAEDLISFLRMTIGSLPVEPVEVVEDIPAKLTSLVEKEYCEDIVLAEKVEMVTEEGAKIVFSKGSVYDQDTLKHIKDGATVTKLMLECDGVTFVLNDKLEASGLKVDKDILCGGKDEAADIITMSEIDRVVKGVVDLFGGEK
jgi:recombination associated protein RdgC